MAKGDWDDKTEDQIRNEGPGEKFGEPGPDTQVLETFRKLTLARWPDMDIPPVDAIVEGFFSTSTRMTIIGQTGAGKTLFALDLAAAMATGGRMLDWSATKPRKVLYLDGELQAGTMQTRARSTAAIYGKSENLVILNRDVIPQGWMEPLERAEGIAWLKRVVSAWSPEVIVYDSVAFLTLIDLKKPEEWRPIMEVMNQFSALGIGQITLSHTGYDATRGYGDASKEWNQDTVLLLTKPGDEDEEEPSGKVEMKFTKARMRTAETAKLYKGGMIQRFDTGWAVVGKATKSEKPGSAFQRNFLKALDLLAADVEPEPGHNRTPVKKVKTDAVRNLMRTNGTWDQAADIMTPTERNRWFRSKEPMLGKSIVEQFQTVWRMPP